MKGFFTNENRVPYAGLIVSRQKPIETRTRNMLASLVGERVAVISTKRGREPMVVGYAYMRSYFFLTEEVLDSIRNLTRIPRGDSFDKYGTHNGVRGKWCYEMTGAEPCEPYPLPAQAVRHGRSWCEF